MSPRFAAALAGVLAVLALAAFALVRGGDEEPPRLVPGSGEPVGASDDVVDPLAYDEDREAQLAASAARGYAHVLYAKSPGGAVASAARTARWRPLVEAAAETAGFDADTLEAMVLLESAGRPGAVADPELVGAVGLTQILAETGENLLGLRVDPRRARAITRSIRRAQRRGDDELVARLRARRARADERFDPAKALGASMRYIAIARDELDDRDDLAVVSYHMGIGNLQNVLEDYGEGEVSYTRLFFDTSPLNNADAWRRLAALGDDSSTYLWRVLAAREIMRLHRSDPDELVRLSRLHTAKNSAEEVLHPPTLTPRFDVPGDVEDAYDDGAIVALPAPELAAAGLRVGRAMGELAGRLDRERALYRGLRPEALVLLRYLGAGVREISGTAPLVLTSTVRDQRYQRLLIGRNPEATQNYSLHTTGWAFDVRRRYRSDAQAQAFQFMLDRLQAHDLVAWVREPGAIHVTVSERAASLLR